MFRYAAVHSVFASSSYCLWGSSVENEYHMPFLTRNCLTFISAECLTLPVLPRPVLGLDRGFSEDAEEKVDTLVAESTEAGGAGRYPEGTL